jgi:hypothetical protein
MAKRFTDTEKWKKPFIRTLPASYKLLWFFILDDCDRSGIWQVDFEVACLKIGEKNLKQDKALELFNKGQERILELQKGAKWFVKEFPEFQYGRLSLNNRMHTGIIESLQKYNLMAVNEEKAPLREEKQVKAVSIHTQCITAYHDWFLEKFEMKPQIDGGDAKGMKAIIEFLDKNQPGDENVLRNWKMVLSIHNRWEDFYQKQTRIRQIASFITNIFTSLKLKQQKNGTGSAISAVEKRFS